MSKTSRRVYVKHEPTGNLLVSREHGSIWAFHAFIGHPFEDEGLATQKVKDLVKSKAIPDSTYTLEQARN